MRKADDRQQRRAGMRDDVPSRHPSRLAASIYRRRACPPAQASHPPEWFRESSEAWTALGAQTIERALPRTAGPRADLERSVRCSANTRSDGSPMAPPAVCVALLSASWLFCVGYA